MVGGIYIDMVPTMLGHFSLAEPSAPVWASDNARKTVDPTFLGTYAANIVTSKPVNLVYRGAKIGEVLIFPTGADLPTTTTSVRIVGVGNPAIP